MTSKKLFHIFITIFITVGVSTYLFLWKKEIDEMREKNLISLARETAIIEKEIAITKEKRNLKEELDSLVEDTKKIIHEFSEYNITFSDLSLYRDPLLELGSHEIKILPSRKDIKWNERPLKYKLIRVDTTYGGYGKVWIKTKTKKKITFVGKTYKNNFLVSVDLEMSHP